MNLQKFLPLRPEQWNNDDDDDDDDDDAVDDAVDDDDDDDDDDDCDAPRPHVDSLGLCKIAPPRSSGCTFDPAADFFVFVFAMFFDFGPALLPPVIEATAWVISSSAAAESVPLSQMQPDWI